MLYGVMDTTLVMYCNSNTSWIQYHPYRSSASAGYTLSRWCSLCWSTVWGSSNRWTETPARPDRLPCCNRTPCCADVGFYVGKTSRPTRGRWWATPMQLPGRWRPKPQLTGPSLQLPPMKPCSMDCLANSMEPINLINSSELYTTLDEHY